MAPLTRTDRRLLRRSPAPTLFGWLLVATMVMTGCSAQGQAEPPSPAPPAAPSTPASPSTPSTPSAASPSPSEEGFGPGCAPTPDEVMPQGATTALVSDLDGDGRDDTEWMSQEPDFRFGITTASGATFSVRDSLAGAGGHNGWTATLGNGANVAVIDDGRGARLFGIAECRFVTPFGVNNEPYTFDMHNLRGTGTGVGCRPADASGDEDQPALATQLQLGGYQVTTNGDGTSTVLFTAVIVAPDSSLATNGDTVTIASSVSSDDPAVVLANRSSCLSVPIVSTDGR